MKILIWSLSYLQKKRIRWKNLKDSYQNTRKSIIIKAMMKKIRIIVNRVRTKKLLEMVILKKFNLQNMIIFRLKFRANTKIWTKKKRKKLENFTMMVIIMMKYLIRKLKNRILFKIKNNSNKSKVFNPIPNQFHSFLLWKHNKNKS